MWNTEITVYIIYIVIVGIEAFILLYPLIKSEMDDFLGKGTNSSAFSLIIIAIAVSYGCIVMYNIMNSFISFLVILSSLASGLSLVSTWSVENRAVELLLFIAGIIISLLLMFTMNYPTTLYLRIARDAIYIIGLTEGMFKYILPNIKSTFIDLGSGEEWGYGFVTITLVLCVFSIATTYIGVNVGEPILTSIHASDITFIFGGLLALLAHKLQSIK